MAAQSKLKRPAKEYATLWNGKRVHIRTQLDDLDRADCEESLHFFLTKAWRYIDPAPFIDGWVLQAVCEHLEAVVDGEIRNLLINIPPRIGKSSIVSVAFPVWVWLQEHIGPVSGPGVPILCASYAHNLARRDSIRRRRLIKTPWFQRLWGHRWQIRDDLDNQIRFANTLGGEMLITSVDAGVTGEGGNLWLIDDPNNAKEAMSDAVAESTNEDWWSGAMPTRLNDQAHGAKVVVQQRLAENDLSGYILDKDKLGEWEHLMLPHHFESARRAITSIGWSDPRQEEGELLWEERFSEPVLQRLAADLGSWRAAGQLEMRPEPKGGGIIKREWWQLWPPKGEMPGPDGKLPPLEFPPMSFILASLDTAFTTDTMNDPSALTVWGIFSQASDINVPTRIIRRDGIGGRVISVYGDEDDVVELTRPKVIPKVMLLYSWTAYLELHKLLKRIDDTCKSFQVDRLIIENKSRGRDVAKELQRTLADAKYAVQLVEVPNAVDKVGRLYSVQHLFEEKMVFAPERPWSEAVITQCGTFPNAQHDDLVDTVSQGLRWLRSAGMLSRPPEMQAETERAIRHVTRRRLAPLYPGSRA